MDHEESDSNSDRWLVSYADFITLMFALFTVLYATSVRDQEKTNEFQESIKRYLIKAGAFGGSGGEVQQGEKFNNPIEPPIQTYQQMSPLSKDVYDEASDFIEQQISESDRRRYVMDLVTDELGVRIILAADTIYDGDTVKFKPSAMEFLTGFGRLCAQTGRRVLIEGHYFGPSYPNKLIPSAWEMGALRSSAMARYLAKIHRIDESSLLPMSLGATRPWPSESNANSPKNRRLEVVLLTENLPL